MAVNYNYYIIYPLIINQFYEFLLIYNLKSTRGINEILIILQKIDLYIIIFKELEQ